MIYFLRINLRLSPFLGKLLDHSFTYYNKSENPLWSSMKRNNLHNYMYYSILICRDIIMYVLWVIFNQQAALLEVCQCFIKRWTSKRKENSFFLIYRFSNFYFFHTNRFWQGSRVIQKICGIFSSFVFSINFLAKKMASTIFFLSHEWTLKKNEENWL